MTTQQQIWDLLGRRPFSPFRVVLTNGENLDVVRVAQAAISDRLFLYGPPEQPVRRIQLKDLDRVEAEIRPVAS